MVGWIILGLLLILIVSLIVYSVSYYYDDIAKIVAIITISLLLFNIIFPFTIILQENELITTRTVETPIVAMKDNLNIQGSSFLFSSYVDETMYYYVLSQELSGVKMEKFLAGNIYIVESDLESPKIVETKSIYKNGFYRWYLGEGDFTSLTQIYIPVGSVIQTYEIDLEE